MIAANNIINSISMFV